MDIKVRCSVCGGVGSLTSGNPPGTASCAGCSGTGLATLVWDVPEFTALVADVTKILKRTKKILDHFEIPDT